METTDQRGASPGNIAVDLSSTGEGRQEQFDRFVRDNLQDLARTAWFLCGDKHAAEELTQEALVRTYVHWRRASARDPLAYTRRTLANLRIDSWRRSRRMTVVDPHELPHTAGRDAFTEVDDRDRLVRALAALTPKQRRVVVYRYLLDLPEAEVASTLGISAGTVKSTASRSLARLQEIFEGAAAFQSSRTNTERRRS